MNLILGIESTCDETAAAIVNDKRKVLSDVVASQYDVHTDFNGVVPELAARAHVERIIPVIKKAIQEANCKPTDISQVAVSVKPGLMPSLLIGSTAAKTLAWILKKPLIPIDHVEAHIAAATLESKPIKLPAIGLVISGGHSHIFKLDENMPMICIGRTIDDAVGEAFDKAATMLGLPWPGGPSIEKTAQDGNPDAYKFPIASLKNPYDFSFSGVKTSLLYKIRGHPTGRGKNIVFPRSNEMLTKSERADYAASFQKSLVTTILLRIKAVINNFPDIKTLVIGGGVARNTLLRNEIKSLAEYEKINLRIPLHKWCSDNAAMIAVCAINKKVNSKSFNHNLSIKRES